MKHALSSRPVALLLCAIAAFSVSVASCGGGGNRSDPDLPNGVIAAIAQFLDVGQRFELDASQSTEIKDRELTFTWRIVDTPIDLEFDDHCADDFEQLCLFNDNDVCSGTDDVFCTSNTDCGVGGLCNVNSGSSSPQCETGVCLVDQGDENEQASFVASIPGPFEIRLTSQSDVATDITSKVLNTYPSLYVVGSLYQLGGTAGGMLGEIADAETFTPEASAGVGNPVSGNLLIIDSDLGLIREFDYTTNSLVGNFGDADRFNDDPVAMAFNTADQLHVIDADGDLNVYSGSSGLLLRKLKNVGAGAVAAAFTPSNGRLLIARGEAGIKAYNTDGTSRGTLGDTDLAVAEAVDIAFIGDDLLIADATGDVIRCDDDGSDCDSFGELDGLLDAGSPSAIVVNPSLRDKPSVAVLVADPVGSRVLACDEDGLNCSTFGDSEDLDSDYLDLVFAPTDAPTTTTTSTTSTTLEP